MNEFQRRALDIAENSAYLAQYARKNAKVIGIEYYAYTTTIAAAVQNVARQALIQIQSDSDFVLTYMSATSFNTATGATVPINGTCQITDTGSGKTFFSAPTPFSLVFGQGGFPFLLPAPRVFSPNTNVKFDATNLGATTVDLYLSLFGARIYYAG